MSRALLVLIMLVAVCGVSTAGEITYRNGEPEWVSTRCNKPLVPGMNSTDATRLNRTILDLESYVNAVNAYNSCLKAEAEEDMAALNKVIVRDVGVAQRIAIDEAEAARSNFVRRR